MADNTSTKYSAFAKRVLAAHRGSRPKRTAYPVEFLQTCADLVVNEGIPQSTVVRNALQEPEWQNHTFTAMISALSRYIARTRPS